MSINHAVFKSMYEGLNAQAQRVYDIVPIEDSWSIHKLSTELGRSVPMEFRVLQGCLSFLVDDGLIQKVDDKYQRVRVRQKPGRKPNHTEENKVYAPNDVTTLPTVASKTPIELLSGIAVKLRDLARDVENVALEIEGQIEKNNADTEKLRQLQHLLKSLGN